ncbi:MAG: heme exporter protein CcmD [Pseudorhodobacter sp.]|nr:heme exporter protein CcmD [Rhizobacter sp.]
MNWASVSDFLAMGGYGLYVWGSFGVTAFVMLLEMWSLSARRKSLCEPSPYVNEIELENFE